MNIFPTLTGKWDYINLAEESEKSGLNLAIPSVCENFINNLIISRRADYFYGGFLEDRTSLWKDHPTEKAKSLIHLGIDYSAPAGTPVTLPLNGKVFHIMKDPENKIGWGGRIIFQLSDGNYLIYGHISQDISLQIGQKIKRRDLIAYIGRTEENGNWWPSSSCTINES